MRIDERSISDPTVLVEMGFKQWTDVDVGPNYKGEKQMSSAR